MNTPPLSTADAAPIPPPTRVAVATVHRFPTKTILSLVAPACLALLTFAVFSPALRHGFVNWDDTTNFLNNEHYRGLAWRNLHWMITTFLMGQWIPLTWLTLGIDYVIWGMNPFGYHLTNIVLHCATAVVWYFLARRILRLALVHVPDRTVTVAAFAAAAFFAIHPLRVESVAWITERRDVLSGLFFMSTILLYLRARDERATYWKWINAASVCYGFAALSKSIVVSLPVVLLLLDVYPLRRLPARAPRLPTAFALLREKWLFFGIAVATGLMAIWAQRWNNFLTPLESLSLLDRILVSLYSVWFYFIKTIMPVGLSPLYELPDRVSLIDRRFLTAAAGAFAASSAAVAAGRYCPGLPIAWSAYLVILIPVSGLVHNGHQLAHDRYSYLSCLPWAVLFGAGVAWVQSASQRRLIRPSLGRLAGAAAGGWIFALATLSVFQTRVWRDDDTLWRFALDADAGCSICHVNLGVSFLTRGLIPQAIAEFEQALALRPDRIRTRANLGVAFMRDGRLRSALTEFHAVLARYPNDIDTANNLAVCLLRLGRVQQGLAELQRILERNPRNILARANLGVALIEDRQAGKGISVLEGVVADKPDHVQARAGLVRGYLALSRYEDAKTALEALRSVDGRAARLLDGLFVTTW